MKDIETRARENGWVPRDEWRGPENRWVDAETFLERADQMIPVMRSQNRKLETQVEGLQKKLDEQMALLAASQDSMEALKEFNAEMRSRDREQLRAQLMQELREARDAGDVEREVAVQDRIAQTREPEKPPVKDPPKPPAQPTESPAFKAWKAENPWWDTNPHKRAIAAAISAELAASGKLANDDQAGNLAKITEATEAWWSENVERRPAGRVEGARAGASTGSVKTYADLPEDARSACDRQEKRLVGPGRTFKDQGAWRKHYVEKYFG
jgi:hypothetical protein